MKINFSYCMLLGVALLFPTESAAKKKPYNGNQKCFDYIIIGLGAAGAVLARKLSDDFCTSVLVLEAGENRILTPETLSPNPEEFETLLAYDPKYSITYPIIAPAGTIIYSEGREWGGGAAHNDMQAVRPNPLDANQWGLDSNNAQWFYPNILPLMKALETYTPDGTIADYTQRGCCGPIRLTQNPPVDSDPLAIAIANVAGAPFVSDYNNALLSNVGTGPIQLFVTPGSDSRRSFSAYDFTTIGEVMDEKGRGLDGRKLRVKGNALVTGIIFDTKGCGEPKAVGVRYVRSQSSKDSEIKNVYASKKVILCAGAINTPKLLMLSGIGDGQMLGELGIDVIVDNPNVGAHLENQYGVIATLTDPYQIPGGQISSFIDERPYMPADSVRRMQLIGINVSDEAAILAALILKPGSVGSVTLASRDPLVPARVLMNMYSDGGVNDVGSDAYLSVSFFKIAQDIAAAAGQTVLYPSPEQYAAGDDALFGAAVNPASLVIAYHTVGTTRMGTSIANGVVDGNLNVFGVRNLMVADIGALPISPSGNTCYSAYVVALIAAQILGVPTPPAV